MSDLKEDFYNSLKEYIIDLRKENIVKFDYDIKGKCIMFCGESGGGKTTLIDLFLNYICYSDNMGKYKSMINYDNENTKNKTRKFEHDTEKSMSFKPQLYKIKLKNNDYFYILDTPGIGDVGGLYNDNINLTNIYYSLLKIKKLNIPLKSIYFVYNGISTKTHILKNYIYNSFKLFFKDGMKLKFIATRKSNLRGLNTIDSNYELFVIDNPYSLQVNLNKRKEYDNSYKNNCLKDGEYDIPLERTYEEFIISNNNASKEIKENIVNFKKIYMDFISNEENINLDDLLYGYKCYLELDSVITKLISEFTEIDDKFTMIVNTNVRKIVEDVVLIQKRIAEITKDKRSKGFCNSPDGIVLTYCEGCYVKHYVSINRKSYKIFPGCKCKDWEEKVIWINGKMNVQTKQELSNLLDDCKANLNNKDYLLKNIVESIEKIDKILDSSNFNHLSTIVKNIQTNTMIRDLELFILEKINYLKNVDVSNDDFLERRRLEQIDRYKKTANILYRNGFNKLKEEMQKQKFVFDF